MNDREFQPDANILHQDLGMEWGELMEAAYLKRFFRCLKDRMGESFSSLRFLLMNQNSRWSRVAPAISGQDVVLVWLGDEEGAIPHELAPKFRLILKSYWPIREAIDNMHPFPLCGSSEVLRREPVPFPERKSNAFFVGNLNSNRIDFYRQFTRWGRLPSGNLPPILSKLIMRGVIHLLSGHFPDDFSKEFPDSEIKFTRGFRQGYAPEEFAARLAGAKMAICPPGFTSPETIRHFEAMRLGCVVISAPLPQHGLYEGSPIIQLTEWASLRPMILQLINEPDHLATRALATMEWWNQRCSPEAMASIIAPILKAT